MIEVTPLNAFLAASLANALLLVGWLIARKRRSRRQDPTEGLAESIAPDAAATEIPLEKAPPPAFALGEAQLHESMRRWRARHRAAGGR